MNDYLPFVVSGIATGSILGLASTGLVLTYKTSGIFNFGHGAIATAAACVFYFLHIQHGWNWVPAVLVSVFVVGPLLGLAMSPIARGLSHRSTSAKIVGTVGIILLVQGLATVWYGSDTISVPQYLPKALEFVSVGGVNISYPQIWVTGSAVLFAALLWGLFRFTRTGLAMRAVVDDPDLLAAQATNPQGVRRVSWAIGCTLAALSGVLVLPFIGLNAISLTERCPGGRSLRASDPAWTWAEVRHANASRWPSARPTRAKISQSASASPGGSSARRTRLTRRSELVIVPSFSGHCAAGRTAWASAPVSVGW